MRLRSHAVTLPNFSDLENGLEGSYRIEKSLKTGTMSLPESWAISSVGRAVRLHRKGRGFKSLIAHSHKGRKQVLPAFVLFYSG